MSITKSRTLVGLAVLSALALTAFAAPSVAHAEHGTTTFTCVKVPLGSGDFNDAHCSVPGGNKEYGHLVISNGTHTRVYGISIREEIRLEGELAGVKAKILCTGGEGTGFVENTEPTTGNHTVTGSEIEIHYTGCDLKLGKSEVTCAIEGGEVTVPSVKSMDVENQVGQEMGAKFEPTKGTTFATFESSAACAVGKQSFTITGTALAVPHGSTLEFTHATTETTLEMGGHVAKFEDIETTSMLNPIDFKVENPISSTTTH